MTVESGEKKCDFLIVDSAGFIKNAPLRELAQHVVSLKDVVNEIRDKDTRQRLQVLPYDLILKEPNVDEIKLITNFSKKTGDYGALSATDIKVMALTLMYEKQISGSIEHLSLEPKIQLTKVNVYGNKKDSSSTEADTNNVTKLPGFFRPEEIDDSVKTDHTVESDSEEVVEDIGSLDILSEERKNNVEFNEEESNEFSEENEEGADDDDDDDEGWITPGNVLLKKKEINGLRLTESEDEPKNVKVACLTTDFAMQNVLIQLGLNVLSLDGMLIKEQKTWLLRCYGCFHTTSLMEKKFCPKCGNATLKRVSCTLNPDGSKQIHISGRRQLNARGKKFSLPAPKGGKHARNPIMTEDQNRAQQRVTRLARQKTDALSDDYIAGNSPFVQHDVNSRSAMLGVPNNGSNSIYWMARNPNSVGKKTGNRKKKSNRA